MLTCTLAVIFLLQVRVCGTTAYVAQTSWIRNGTIQENILFGSPMNTERYKEVIRVCCLEKDLEVMEFGDQTEIGERGSTWVVARSNAYNLLEPFIRTVISIFLTIYLVLLMLRLVQKYLRLKQNLIKFWNMWCSLCLFIVKLHVAPAALSICWWPSSWGLFFLVLQLAVKCFFQLKLSSINPTREKGYQTLHILFWYSWALALQPIKHQTKCYVNHSKMILTFIMKFWISLWRIRGS